MDKDKKEILKEHFLHPKRQGALDKPDGTGIVGNARCGDILSFQIKVDDDRISQVRFQCLGCGAGKAVASYIAELVEGKPIQEVEKIKMEDIFTELADLPKNKWHCPFQAMDALKMAIEDFHTKQREGKRKMIDVEPVKEEFQCPYCQAILGENLELCQSCEYKEIICQNCGKQIIDKQAKKQ